MTQESDYEALANEIMHPTSHEPKAMSDAQVLEALLPLVLETYEWLRPTCTDAEGFINWIDTLPKGRLEALCVATSLVAEVTEQVGSHLSHILRRRGMRPDQPIGKQAVVENMGTKGDTFDWTEIEEKVRANREATITELQDIIKSLGDLGLKGKLVDLSGELES